MIFSEQGQERATENTCNMSGGSQTLRTTNQDDDLTGDKSDQLPWLKLEKEAENNQTRRQKIHKVPAMLRRKEAYQNCFDPLVVSIGPYHHGKPELKLMEQRKVEMANQYTISNPRVQKHMYNKLKNVAEDARNCYVTGSAEEFQGEKFNRMMFLDGCFVIQFIYCLVYESEKLNMKSKMVDSVQRDLLLLENQIPFPVLKELLSFRFQENEWKKMFGLFVELIPGRPSKYSRQEMTGKKLVDDQKTMQLELIVEPAHLLELVRTQLINKPAPTVRPQSFNNFSWCSFHSAKQLEAAGIGFGISKTGKLTDINFTSKKILELPLIIISDTTKSFLLNMIAYETCPDGSDDLGVTSYVCFMDSLIDDAEDVKELRLNGIISSFVGNDKKIADFFHQIATDLVPNFYAYAKVKDQVEEHYKNYMKVCPLKYFALIALFGGISALVLSVVRT